jgi:hypothetical protein
MRSIKGSLAGLVLAGILAMIPGAGFAHGGGGGGHGGGGGGRGFGGGSGGHAFVGGGGRGFGGGHAFGGFTGRGFSPGFSGMRGFSTGRFSGRGDHGRFDDRGFRDHRVFSQQFAWPVYWYPYYPYDYSYLDYGPDNDYQYGDNSAASVQPESFRPAVDHGPVIINTGNSRPMDSTANAAYINSGYSSTDAAGQQRIVTQGPNEKIGPRADPRTVVAPVVPQPTQPMQTAAKGTQTTRQAQAGAFGNLVLVSWLEDAGKDVIYVQNTETNDVQKITSEPNLDNFRIVVLHPNADPRLFEAVISNGSQQGPVRFRF